MKTLRDYTLNVSLGAPVAIAAIESRLTNGWYRNKEKEKYGDEFISHYRPGILSMYCFSCTEFGPRQAATLWLYETGGGKLFMSDIFAEMDTKLSSDECNCIAEEFYQHCIVPAAEIVSMSVD
ncbi:MULTISPECIES: hypothetical protein [Trichocoleus]|uniref:Uncharacterized protein n=1 Tax=Trichocoleus desertorum GB2-A4 TaxID=2933944 RepID=A0ABV0JCS7_9CYAN|nr:hypothetical protein [Trichocoleus sp. FACHB-46]MBD1864239.1 hypothetical protein [Trichocoleus sp. FACHB-46]